MKKYEAEFKLKVVQSFLAGEGGAKLNRPGICGGCLV
jgi:hypothetical protein